MIDGGGAGREAEAGRRHRRADQRQHRHRAGHGGGGARATGCILTMPDTMSMERRNLLRAFGAEMVLTPGAKGMRGAVERRERLVAETPGAWMPQQFENPANPEVHRQDDGRGNLGATRAAQIDAFVAGVGTGGTITGVGRSAEAAEAGRQSVSPWSPPQSPIFSGGQPGPHKIQGIGANFIPKVLNRDILDGVITVTDDDAWATMAPPQPKSGPAGRHIVRRRGGAGRVPGGGRRWTKASGSSPSCRTPASGT